MRAGPKARVTATDAGGGGAGRAGGGGGGPELKARGPRRCSWKSREQARGWGGGRTGERRRRARWLKEAGEKEEVCEAEDALSESEQVPRGPIGLHAIHNVIFQYTRTLVLPLQSN